MFDYRLFFPEGSIAEDRRARLIEQRQAKRIYQLPPRQSGRHGRRR